MEDFLLKFIIVIVITIHRVHFLLLLLLFQFQNFLSLFSVEVKSELFSALPAAVETTVRWLGDKLALEITYRALVDNDNYEANKKEFNAISSI
jgi:hypothetical protein